MNRKTIGILVLLVGLAIFGILLIIRQLQPPTPIQPLTLNQISAMQLTSPAFEHNGKISSKYTCDGDNVSPPLHISGVPEGTKSLVLIVDDPDAMKPAGKVWVHWTVWNIPPDATTIAENTAPSGVEGTTDFQRTSWGGPCPPDAEHRYFFKLYALDTILDLSSRATKKDIEAAMRGRILAETSLIGLYERL